VRFGLPLQLGGGLAHVTVRLGVLCRRPRLRRCHSRKDRITMARVRGVTAAPRRADLDEAKTKFVAINGFVSEGGCWLVSVPGDPDMRLRALPGSPLPDQLAALSYIVEKTGATQRILPHAMTVKFTTRADGELTPLTEG
jgi:hypothetical protein